MPSVLCLTIHRGHTTLKHQFHANGWALGNKSCIIKQSTPVCVIAIHEHGFQWEWCFQLMQGWQHILQESPFPRGTSAWRAAQAWFLSLAKLQSQIPSLCSGFPLGLTRGLSTKRRLLIICLKIPLRSTGKYGHPLVVTTLLCVVTVQRVFCKWMHAGKWTWGRGDVFTLLEPQSPLCQNPKIWFPLGISLSRLYFGNHLRSPWLLAPQGNPGLSKSWLMSGDFRTQASQDLACPSWREGFANPALCMCLSFGPKIIQRWN